MIVSLFLLNFSGAFASNYIEASDGQALSRTICFIGVFSPTVQLLYGILFI